jgi:SAM-dependent methyltransferase
MIGGKRMLAALCCRLSTLKLELLRMIFGFDPWHSHASYHCRPYKRVLVDIANSVVPQTVVEVGCGLGDIVRRVRARSRIGLDIDGRVIRAARFLNPRSVRWIEGDGSMVERCIAPGQDIDCLIMVNWTHNVAADQLASLLLPLLPRTKYLILDAIDADAPASYRFRHTFAFLMPFAARVSTTRVDHEPRSFILLKVTG